MGAGVLKARWAAGIAVLAAVSLGVPTLARAQGSDLVVDHGVGVERHDAHESAGRFVLEPSLEWRGSKTITYFNEAGKYKDEVKKAASAWNKSGANVNWKPTSQSSAKVIIEIEPNLPTQGQANTNGTSAVILLQEDLLEQFPPRPSAEAITAAIVAHEMGHVMGLGHEPRKCATMNANLWNFCKSPDEAWEYRCRPLEPDDVRGGAKAFGGNPKKLPRPFCALGKPPSAVSDFLAAYDADEDEVELTWSLPSRNPPKDLTIYRGKRDESCPDQDGKGAAQEFAVRPNDGRIRDFGLSAGSYCYTAVGFNEYGRPGKTAKNTVEVVGEAPEANFEYFPLETTAVEFSDLSIDDDGEIVAWEWDFGDGSAASTEQNPVHVFAAPGIFEVTLTVTDDGGLTESITKSVSVANGEPPVADFDYLQSEGTTVEFFDYSYDDDGAIVSWEWDFGDGSAGSAEPEPIHTYTAAGEYDVTLTVSDEDGNRASVEYSVFVE